MKRPEILIENEDGLKLSKNLVGVILNKNNEIKGIMLTDKDSSFMQFANGITIIIDKHKGEITWGKERNLTRRDMQARMRIVERLWHSGRYIKERD